MPTTRDFSLSVGRGPVAFAVSAADSMGLLDSVQNLWVPGGSFVLGTTKPDATNTGAKGPLTTFTGDMVITTPGTVIDSMDIFGYVSIQAANVTIQNSRIRGRDSGFVYYGLVDCRSAGLNAVIKFCTLRADYPKYWQSCISGSNFTSNRNDMSNTVDGHDCASGIINITGNYCHDFAFFNNSPEYTSSDPSGWTHNDGFQIYPGAGQSVTVLVKGNNFYWYPDPASPGITALINGTGGGTYYSSPNMSAYSSRPLWGSCMTGIPTRNAINNATVTQNWCEGGTDGFQCNVIYPVGGTMNFGELSYNRFGMDQYNYGSNSRYQIRYKNGFQAINQTTNYFDPNAGSVPPALQGVNFSVGFTSGIRVDP